MEDNNKISLKRNIYVDGVFDLFHEGHINFLQKASTYGKLIVGVHDDNFVSTYKRRPYISEKTRYAVVKACKYVDVVIEGVGILTEDILHEYNINLVLHGDDFSLETAYKFYAVAIDRKIFEFTEYTKSVSSSILIQKIEERIKIEHYLHKS